MPDTTVPPARNVIDKIKEDLQLTRDHHVQWRLKLGMLS